MPSDDRTRRVLEAFARPLGAFRATVVATAGELRARLAGRRLTADERRALFARQLGPFGAAHIDAARFAAVLDGRGSADPVAVEALERSIDALQALAARGDDPFAVRVERGDVSATVGQALASLGRVFAAARAARGAVADVAPIGDLPYSHWNRAERRVAPPLVVEVDGAALRPAGLAEFLDGRQKIALVVTGPCPPAPLARLITPGTFVLQTGDDGDLERFVAWDGPGVAALLPEGTARFVHDPAAGGAPWDRLTVSYVPSEPPKRSVGGLSAAQQAEELELLAALASGPGPAAAAAPAAGAVGVPDADPADRLAAWLLSQVDLRDAG